MCGCCLRACCVSSRISYRLKQVIPWHFIYSYLFILMYVFLFIKIITSLRVEIPPLQHPFLHFCFVFLLIYYYYYVLTMFQTNLIMTQDQINCLQNKSRTGECCLKVRRVISWSCYGLKQGIPWQFGFVFYLFLLI